MAYANSPSNSGRKVKPIQCIQSGNLTMSPSFNWICSEPIKWGELECRLDLSYSNNEFRLNICNVDGEVISFWPMHIDRVLAMFEEARDYKLTQDELELTGMLYPRGPDKGELGPEGGEGFGVGWGGGA